MALLLALFIYYAAIVWLHWDHGNKWLIFQPFYCLFVSLIVVPIGVAYYSRWPFLSATSESFVPSARSLSQRTDS